MATSTIKKPGIRRNVGNIVTSSTHTIRRQANWETESTVMINASINNGGEVFGTGRTEIATIPAGYRPPDSLFIAISAATAVNYYANRTAYAVIATNGKIYIDLVNADIKEVNIIAMYPNVN